MKTNQLNISPVLAFIRSNLALCLAVATLGATGVVHATTALTWDGSADFQWNSTSPNWGGVAWTAGDDAVFGSSGVGTITVVGTNYVGTGSDTPLTFNTAGYTLTGGVLKFPPSSSAVLSTLSVGANVEIDSKLAATNALSQFWVTGAGTLTLNSGATVTNTVGVLFVTNGFVTLQSGTFNVIGGAAGATTGGVEIKGSTLTVAGGTLNSTAGTYNNTASGGILNITGGTYNFTGSEFLNAYGTPGTINLSGTGVFNVNTLRVCQTALGGVINLNGGTLKFIRFNFGTGPGTVNFNGTAIQCKQSLTVASPFNTPGAGYAYIVQLGGAIINTEGYSIISTTNLSHDLTLGTYPDGGLTVDGTNGTLTLTNWTGPSSYTGPTTVINGTLSLWQPSLSSISCVILATNGGLGSNSILNLNFAGSDTVGGLVLGGVQMPAGTYNHSTTPAYITGAGSLVSLGGAPSTNLVWSGAVNNNWDATTTNWSQSGASTSWVNSNPSLVNAVFSGSSVSTVNLTTNINVNDLVVTAPGYTFASNPGGTLTLNGPGINAVNSTAATISGTITNTANLTKSGSGVLTLSGGNYFTGGVTNQGGVLALGNVNALNGAVAGAVAGGSLEPSLFDTFANVPTVILNGLGADIAANYGALDFNTGGAGTVNWNGNLVLASTAAISSYGSGNIVNLNGVISGPGNLILAARGADNSSQTAVDVLNQVNTYQGTSQILNRSGLLSYTIQLGVANALPATTVVDISTVSNVVGQAVSLDLNGFNQTVAGLTSTANSTTRAVINSSGTPATLTISNNTSDVFNGVVGTSGANNLALVKQGAGELTITNANYYTGGTTISGGQLDISPNNAYGSGNYTVAANATLNSDIFNGSSVNMNNLTLQNGSTNTITLLVPGNPGSAAISVTSLTVNGPTTINLSGSQLSVGTFQLIAYGGGSVGGTGGFSALHLGALPGGVNGQLVDSGSSVELQILAVPQNLTWRGTVNGIWDINGTSNWFNTDISGSSNYKETSSIGDNVTFDDSGGGSPSITLNTTVHPSVMIANNDASVTYTISGSGKISGPTGLQILGGGMLVLATTNDYSGVTTLAGGILQIGNGGNVGSLGTNTVSVTYNGTDLAFNRTDAITVNNAIVNAGGNPNVDINSGTVTLGGSADNLGTVASVNAGTLVLGKTSSPTVDAVDGLHVFTGGLVQLGGTGGNQIKDSVTVQMNGGTFDLAGQDETFTSYNGYGVVTNSGVNGTVTLINPIGVVCQNGMLTFAGGTNNGGTFGSYGGGTFQQTGGTINCTLFYDGTAVGSGGTAVADFEGGTFNDSGQLLVGFNAPGLLTVGGSAVVNIGQLGLGDNTGTAYLNGGTLNLQYFHDAGANPCSVYFNGCLVRGTANVGSTFFQSTTSSYIVSTGGAIIDSQANALGMASPLVTDPALGSVTDGGLIKLGTGSLTLSATNTYTGQTVVSNGTLVVNGVLGTNAVSVGAGATLVGSGIIGGSVTVNSNGILNVGGYGTNVLTINNTLTFMPGSTNVAIIYSTNGTCDLVTGITTANYAGTLQVYDLVTPSTPTNGQTFQIFSASSFTGNFTSIISSPSGGLGWSFNPTNGVLTYISTVNTSPTNLTWTVSSGSLILNWPSDHTGWRLLEQTNNLNLGISSNTNDWGTVSGSVSTNQMTIPINLTNPADFYRLVYP